MHLKVGQWEVRERILGVFGSHRFGSTLHSQEFIVRIPRPGRQKETHLKQLQCVRYSYYLSFTEIYNIHISDFIWTIKGRSKSVIFGPKYVNTTGFSCFYLSMLRCFGSLRRILPRSFWRMRITPLISSWCTIIGTRRFFPSDRDEEGCTNQLTTILQYHACITSIYWCSEFIYIRFKFRTYLYGCFNTPLEQTFTNRL